MTPRFSIGLAGGACAAIVVAASGLAFLAPPWSPEAMGSRRQEAARADDVVGYVMHVDLATGQVDVSTSRFGFHPIRVQVGGDTAILVDDKQGGLGDLWKDMPVRIAYEQRGDVRLARSIVVARDGRAAEAVAPTIEREPQRPTPREPQRPTPAGPAAAPTLAAPTPAASPKAPAAMVRPVAPSTAEPRPAAEPPVTKPARQAAQSTPRVPRPAPPPPRSPSPASEGDGSAAIDWLLNESGRR